MADKDQVINLFDFSGGLNTFAPEFQVAENQATDLQNINLFDRGFEKRRGDSAFNSSVMVDATTAITGLGYMKFNSGTEFLNAVAGTKFFTSSSLTGTMADKTGAVAITASQNNIWIAVPFNNIQIWVGGAANPPFKHDGTASNASALGGSPPSARTAFVAANRVFMIYNSILAWCTLSNPEDWTGSGSGTQQVSKDDGELLQFGVPIGNNVAILFKNSSTHKALLNQAPFPVIPIQKGTGAAGHWSYCVVDGVIYFVTPGRRMKATIDGSSFIDFPSSIDDVWDSINTTRIPYIQGIYYENLGQIHWYVSTGSSTTNNLAIVWDLKHKSWLVHPTGFDVNVAAIARGRTLYGGHYDGKVYQKDVANTYSDSSEASPGAIDAFFQTNWRSTGISDIVHPRWIDAVVLTQTSGTFDIEYGFDFSSSLTAQTFSMQGAGDQWGQFLWGVGRWGGQTSVSRRAFTAGRGNVMSARFRNANAGEAFQFQGATIYLRPVGTRKQLQVV
jgi:hypothetical protein